MEYKFNYEIIQFATQVVSNKEDVVTEIRFYHTLDVLEGVKKLYVAHLKYDNGENYITGQEVMDKGKEFLFPYIENTLGSEQIKHMENILIEELKNQKNESIPKQYFTL